MENPQNALLLELHAIFKYSDISLSHFIQKSTGKAQV